MKLGLMLALLLGACATEANHPRPEPKATAADAVTETTDVGPVVARVSLSPKTPRVGDVLTLTLEVEAEDGIALELPPFGEALGRFSVLKFTPRRDRKPDGKEVHAQTYTLQAPGSGRQRIPQLRIEFTTKDGENRELLTEELPIEIESVVAANEISAELSPSPGPLDETPGYPWWLWPAVLGVAALTSVGAWLAMRERRRKEILRAQIGAFERALARLQALEERGLPASDDADPWYVELSGIVRHYLEDRLQIRAPELTTEEFLQGARAHSRLDGDARELLSQFLALCDRVKFAAYHPSEEESQLAMSLAKDILTDQEQALRDIESASEATTSGAA